MKGLEDALQAAAAQSWGAEKIVTRNLYDYRNALVPALSPTAFNKWTAGEQDTIQPVE